RPTIDYRRPRSRIPGRLRAQCHRRVPRRPSYQPTQTFFGAHVAHAAMFTARERLELVANGCQRIPGAHRSSGNDQSATTARKTHDSAPIRGKPQIDARIQNLISGGVPTVRHYDLTREFDIDL